MSLYDTLGIPADADKAAIRAAYRRRAKQTHPDSGGSAAEFQAVELAHRVLISDDRRARYDETGDVDERANNDEADAMSIIAAMVDHALTKDDLKHHDLIGAMRKQINDDIATARKTIAEGNAYIGRAYDARKRLKAKKRDVIGPVIDRKVAEAKQQLVGLERQIKLRERALALLEGTSFEFEPAAPKPYVWPDANDHLRDAMLYTYQDLAGRRPR